MLGASPFTNSLCFCIYREEAIVVASKQVCLIPDGFESVTNGVTWNLAVQVNIWNHEFSKTELSSKGGENSGGDWLLFM